MCFVVVVCGANVETGSTGTFTAVAESMYVNVGGIGANHLPVDLEL
jgi:hypothetical protein